MVIEKVLVNWWVLLCVTEAATSFCSQRPGFVAILEAGTGKVPAAG